MTAHTGELIRGTIALAAAASPTRLRRYLADRDVWHAAAVSVAALLASGGLIWVGYLLHVLRIARHSPLQPPERMIVLVFGRRLERDEPGPDYRHRLSRALTLARAQLAERLLLLGGRSGTSSISEAAAGHRWLQQQALPAQVPVQLEHESTDSLENLRQARALLQPGVGAARFPPVALVTSRYHLARCQLLARRLGFHGVPVAAEPSLSWSPRQVRLLLLESAYVMWIDLGVRWAQLIGHHRMAGRIR
ncbi:YdcF family protein [Dyella sp.]|uniref:YdcF family protein n=1 Tax=Dyella sp. TaxID=1869338 RepID=UPI002D77DB2B|nr:YdcF family protein [Dyella sp.]HET6430646.1 YdcF family protein [Dyella sp.]